MIPIAFDAEDALAKSKFILLVVVRQFCCLALEYVKTNLAGSVMLAMAHFTPFEIGQIKAHAYHGMSGAAISRILVKPKSTSSDSSGMPACSSINFLSSLGPGIQPPLDSQTP